MNADSSAPNLSYDERGRAYRQIGTSRIYVDERSVSEGDLAGGHRTEHSYYSTPVPARHEMSSKFRALRTRPWSEPRPPAPPAP